MCGFCGFTGANENAGGIVRAMSERIAHRGPDGYGEFLDGAGRFNCAFRRLSLIDLEGGDQPIFNENRSLVVFMNGEIYNYKQLREELIEKGHVFSTHSDTETLAHLYEEYGEDMTGFLRGMFAFVIFDTETGSIFGARDFFGIKPFYYARVGNELLFGSEIKAFMAHPAFEPKLNERALEHYLTFQYSPGEETFFEGVYKLPPGCRFTWKDAEMSVVSYYDKMFRPNENMTEAEAVDSIEAAVLDSVEAHKVSDVEVGSFLSSGVDSSFVAATFNGGKTFTVGFDYDNYNEIDYAKRLSAFVGIENFEKLISTEEYWAALPKVQYHMDEPLADPSAVALYFVSRLASGHVKAAMSGEGADEFFGGYNIYKEPLDLAGYRRLPRWLRKCAAAVAGLLPDVKGKGFLIRGALSVEERFIGNAKLFSVGERKKLLRVRTDAVPPFGLTGRYYKEAAGLDDITKMQYLDVNMWLVGDILLKADKMSMAHSLEVRVPFLDKRVFEAARVLPTRLRTNKVATKYAFRKAAGRHVPPESAEKKKLGFPVPTRVWLREDRYFDIVRAAFSSRTAREYFDAGELDKLLTAHKRGKRDNSRKIWAVYMFLVWHEQFFGEAGTLYERAGGLND